MVLGIRIEARSNVLNEEFRLFIGEPKEGELFFTNKKIQKAIEKNPSVIGEQTGRITYSLNINFRTFTSWEYYPISKVRFKKEFKEIINKTGFATLAELTILKQLEKEYPSHFITTTKLPENKRNEQLHKQRRKAAQTIPIKDAIKLLESYVRKRAFIYRIRERKFSRIAMPRGKTRKRTRTKPK